MKQVLRTLGGVPIGVAVGSVAGHFIGKKMPVPQGRHPNSVQNGMVAIGAITGGTIGAGLMYAMNRQGEKEEVKN